MLCERLVNIITNYGVQIHFFDEPKEKKDYCYAIIIPETELNIIRGKEREGENNDPVGVHILRCDSAELLENYKEQNFPGVLETTNELQQRFSIPSEQMHIAYTLFVILHEIGHVLHHLESGLSNSEYWYRYNGSRDDVWMIYQFCHNVICKNFGEQQLLQTFVNQIYRNIPSEKYADKFAFDQFASNWQKLLEVGLE